MKRPARSGSAFERNARSEANSRQSASDWTRNATHLVQRADSAELTELQTPISSESLAELDEAIAHNDYRAANIRAGYVYVISNRGAFGENVVKIGLTRRLEPLERVNELAEPRSRSGSTCTHCSSLKTPSPSRASSTALCRAARQPRERAEGVLLRDPGEVRDVLLSKVGNLLEFHEEAEATEYLQSVSAWPERHARAGLLG